MVWQAETSSTIRMLWQQHPRINWIR